MMRCVCFLLAAAVVLQITPAFAQEKSEGPTVFVPYDDLEKVLAEPKPRVLISLEEYRKLREAALRPEKKPPVEAALLEAHYTGVVEGDAAKLAGRFVIQCISRDAVRLALPMQGLSVASVSGAGEGMLVGPADSGVEVILTKPGRYELNLQLVGKVTRDAGRARLRAGLPAAAVSRLEILLPEKNLAPRLAPEVSFFTIEDARGTLVKATLGAAREIELSWQPRVERLTELPAALYVAGATRLRVEETLVKAECDLRFRIAHAPVETFELTAPAGYSVVAVEGEGLKEWTVSDRVISVRLFAPVGNAYALGVELQRVRSREEARMDLPLVRVVDAKQEQGYFAVGHADTLSVRPIVADALAQVEVKDLPADLGKDARLGLRYLAGGFAGGLAVSQLAPELRARTVQHQDVTEERVRVRAGIALEVRQTGVLRLLVGLPADAQEVTVSGPKVADFDVRDGEGEKIVAVQFAEMVLGQTDIRISFELGAAAEKLALAPIRIEGARHHEGWIGVALADVYRASVGQTQGLRAVSAAETLAYINAVLEDVDKVDLGFRYVEAPFAAVIALARKEATVTAQVAGLANVETDHIRVRYDVTYAIRYGAVERLRFTLGGKHGKEAHITGPGIKEKNVAAEDEEGKVTWEVLLQKPAKESYHLTVELERPIDWQESDESVLGLPELVVLDVDRESGLLAVARTASLAVRPMEKENLEPVDYRELPAGLQVANVFLAYRYFRHPARCAFAVEKGKPALVMGTLINYEVVVAALAADGSCTADVMWEFQNNARQELAVELPEEARILMVELDGKPITPRRRVRDKKLVVPVERTEGDERRVLHLAYMIEDARGAVTAATPEDVEIVGSHWRVHVAPNRRALFFRTPLRLANRWRLSLADPFVPTGPLTALGKTVFERGAGTGVSRAGEIRVHLDPRSRAYSFVGPARENTLDVVSLGVLPWRLATFALGFILCVALFKTGRLIATVIVAAVALAAIVLGVVAGAMLEGAGWAVLGLILAAVVMLVSRRRRHERPPAQPAIVGIEGGSTDA